MDKREAREIRGAHWVRPLAFPLSQMGSHGRGTDQGVPWPGFWTRWQHPLSEAGADSGKQPHSAGALLCCRCDEQTAKKLVTYFGHFGSADHACTLGELEARIAVLVEQLGTQGCSEKTLGTPGEEVS